VDILIKMLEAGDPSTTYNVFKVKEEGMKQGSGTHMPLEAYVEEIIIFGAPRRNVRDD